MLEKGKRYFIREATGNSYDGIYAGMTSGMCPRIILDDAYFVGYLDLVGDGTEMVKRGTVYIADHHASVIEPTVIHE